MFQTAPKLIWPEKQEEADENALSTNEAKEIRKGTRWMELPHG